jgi:hypothetical protein
MPILLFPCCYQVVRHAEKALGVEEQSAWSYSMFGFLSLMSGSDCW